MTKVEMKLIRQLKERRAQATNEDDFWGINEAIKYIYDKAMKTPQKCPYCGNEDITDEWVEHSMHIMCSGCGLRGPKADTKEGAITAWNRMGRREIPYF
jgi:Lar family restriction alleviation protein